MSNAQPPLAGGDQERWVSCGNTVSCWDTPGSDGERAGYGQWSGGRGFGGRGMRGEGDRHAGVELFEFADLVAGLALGVAPGIVARAQLDIAEAGIADDQAGDLADGAGDGDDGFLLAAAAGDAPVAFTQEGVG